MQLSSFPRPAPVVLARIVLSLVTAFAAFCAVLVPHSSLAAPVPDASFGDAGRVHLGVPTGFEETVYASTLQADGKVVVAGTSIGRQD